ncbi:MAG: hypothetical protein MUF54_23255 [Polyangiaceae bacterium]|nr:hypothetical protein [Polyangiaceae bacterium]
MRLGLIGPSAGNTVALKSRARYLLDVLRADRVVYLGVDGSLESVVEAWAFGLVGGDPSDEAVWARAAARCLKADSTGIDAFLKTERQRARLRQLEALPRPDARSIELIENLVAVLIHDKALLDEEDILPATLLLFGKASEPVVHRVGQRLFVSPGPVDHPRGGAALVAEERVGVVVSVYGPSGVVTRREVAGSGKAARLMVQGASS